MTASKTAAIVTVVHHLLAVYSVSAERFALPFARFGSEILFPAVLILNPIPLVFAAAFGAAIDSVSGSSPAASVFFVVGFIFFSTLQWIVLGLLLSKLLIWLSNRSKTGTSD